jgi:hypothetical protein
MLTDGWAELRGGLAVAELKGRARAEREQAAVAAHHRRVSGACTHEQHRHEQARGGPHGENGLSLPAQAMCARASLPSSPSSLICFGTATACVSPWPRLQARRAHNHCERVLEVADKHDTHRPCLPSPHE